LKPCTTAVHAEANAVAFAAKHGVSTRGSTLYTVFLPCGTCAPLLVNAGVVRVVAATDRGPSPNSLVGRGRELLETAGIEIIIVGGDVGARTS
jgi:dCMP deaminase